MQNCLIEPDGDTKMVSGDGSVDVGAYFLGAEQAGLCRPRQDYLFFATCLPQAKKRAAQKMRGMVAMPRTVEVTTMADANSVSAP